MPRYCSAIATAASPVGVPGWATSHARGSKVSTGNGEDTGAAARCARPALWRGARGATDAAYVDAGGDAGAATASAVASGGVASDGSGVSTATSVVTADV